LSVLDNLKDELTQRLHGLGLLRLEEPFLRRAELYEFNAETDFDEVL
jgi:hypothetical protein